MHIRQRIRHMSLGTHAFALWSALRLHFSSSLLVTFILSYKVVKPERIPHTALTLSA